MIDHEMQTHAGVELKVEERLKSEKDKIIGNNPQGNARMITRLASS